MCISIVIPLFNKEQSIERAIKSVQDQNVSPREIWVVDDGSTDRSAEVVESINDERLRLHRQSNSGVSKARNKGAELASSEWIFFLDADDEFESDFLQRMLALIKSQPSDQLSMVGSDYHNMAYSDRMPKRSGGVPLDSFFGNFDGQKTPLCSSSFGVRRSRLLEIGGYPVDQSQFEDWTLYFRLALRGECLISPDPLAIYHCDERGGSKSLNSIKLRNNATMLLEKVWEDLDGLGNVGVEKREECIRAMERFYDSIASHLLREGPSKIVASWAMCYPVKRLRNRLKPFLRPKGFLQLVLPNRLKQRLRSGLKES